MSDWWSNIEREIDRLSEDAPDPWADASTHDAPIALTADQIAFLEQIGGASDIFADADDWTADDSPADDSSDGPRDEPRDPTGAPA